LSMGRSERLRLRLRLPVQLHACVGFCLNICWAGSSLITLSVDSARRIDFSGQKNNKTICLAILIDFIYVNCCDTFDSLKGRPRGTVI
jgi:hypothetical protein